jgi:hypothetical protein
VESGARTGRPLRSTALVSCQVQPRGLGGSGPSHEAEGHHEGAQHKQGRPGHYREGHEEPHRGDQGQHRQDGEGQGQAQRVETMGGDEPAGAGADNFTYMKLNRESPGGGQGPRDVLGPPVPGRPGAPQWGAVMPPALPCAPAPRPGPPDQ